MSADEPAKNPALQVIRGDATAEEVAAIVAVLAAAGGRQAAPEPPASRWGGRARHTWKASALPSTDRG